jgi:hypothetical protein
VVGNGWFPVYVKCELFFLSRDGNVYIVYLIIALFFNGEYEVG